MPKEILPPSTPDAPYQVQVVWTRDLYMNIAVAGVDGRSLFWSLLTGDGVTEELGFRLRELVQKAEAEYPRAGTSATDREQAAKLGEALLNTLDTVSVEKCGGYDSIHVLLERAACNDLIRTLRRARDQAYGQDA